MKKPKKLETRDEMEARLAPHLAVANAVNEMERQIDRLDVDDWSKKMLHDQLDEVLSAALGAGKDVQKYIKGMQLNAAGASGRKKKQDRRLDIIGEIISGKTGSNKALTRDVYDEFKKRCEVEGLKPYSLTNFPRYVSKAK